MMRASMRSARRCRKFTLFPSPLRGGVRGGGRAAVAALLLLASSSAFAQTAFTPRDESPEEFAAGAGRDETFYACTACHNFKLVAAQGLTRAGWEESLNLMVRKHNMPALDDKDRDVVLNYLETAYPPRAPAAGRGWQNPFMQK
jgi:mono/diheme cytochrome c family protein